MKNSDSKTRYSDEELGFFREIVKKKLFDARQQLDMIRQQQADLAGNPEAKVRGLDDATNAAEVERLSNSSVRLQKHIRHLENALIRIDNKVYGICRVTNKLIAKERLIAVPHATLSIAAKEQR
ncbi:MAG: TraR/DksA C4-type zinc finger protein [Bacteroidota bacterium]